MSKIRREGEQEIDKLMRAAASRKQTQSSAKAHPQDLAKDQKPSSG